MSHISDIWSLFNSDINMGPEGWVPKRGTWPQSSVQYSIYRAPKCSKVMHKDWFVPLSAGEEGGWTCGQESLGSGTANPRDVANAVKPSTDTIKPSVTLSCQNTQYFLLCSCRMDGEPSQKVKQISFVPNIPNSASVSNEGLGVKILWASIRLPSAFRQIPSLFRQIWSPPSYSEPIPEMEDFSGDRKGSVWNGWELKFYVNSCVKMSSSHVCRVTCGIFPCEPNLDWRVTIWKVKVFDQGPKCAPRLKQ